MFLFLLQLSLNFYQWNAFLNRNKLNTETSFPQIVNKIKEFIEPVLLENITKTWNPNKLRQNSKLFRSLIKLNAPSLKKIGLAKGQFVHPYYFNSLQSRLWSTVREKFEWSEHHKDDSYQLLILLKDFVFDTLNSHTIKESPVYDYKKIKNIIESYYKGNLSYKSELDWWLSFELFRQSL